MSRQKHAVARLLRTGQRSRIDTLLALGYPAGAMIDSALYYFLVYLGPIMPLLLLLARAAAEQATAEIANTRRAAGPSVAAVTHAGASVAAATHTVQAAPTPVTHAVDAPSTPAPRAKLSGAERQARYRAKHGAAYRQGHADYMRFWRAGKAQERLAAAMGP
jgi:hypothetical protein